MPQPTHTKAPAMATRRGLWFGQSCGLGLLGMGQHRLINGSAAPNLLPLGLYDSR
jgi:hypothetical protein